MEEQLTLLLIKILNKKQNYQSDENILDKYYTLFDNKKYLGKNFKEIYNDIRKTYNIDLQSLRYGYNNINEQRIYEELILSIIREKNIKNKIKLIPLIIYLDSNRIFYDDLYNINYFDNVIYDIKDFFLGTISDSGIKVNDLEELSPYHYEKEWFDKYKRGLYDLNFSDIYSFIEGMERGFGHEFDIYLDFLVFIAYKYFFGDLVNILNKKQDMFEIIYLIHGLSIEETLILSKESNNYLLKFEVIRKSVYFKSNNISSLNLLMNERSLLKEVIIQLAKDKLIYKQFLDFYLKYPLRSVQLFEPLSNVIFRLNYNNIDLIIDSIEIDRYLNEDSKNALNSMFFNIKDKEKQKYISKKLYNKWITFIENYEDYFGSIILTDVIDIVIYYIQEHLDKDNIVNQLKKSILNIQEIDNKWFKDITEQNNYFYKQMSKIFVYSWAIDKYNLEEYKFQIQNICDNSYLLKKEEGHGNEKTTLKLFEEYILKGSDSD